MPRYTRYDQPSIREIITTQDNITYILGTTIRGDNDMLYLGNNYEYCIIVTIHHDKHNTTASLNYVHYADVCCVYNKSKRSISTKDTILTIISIIKHKYPHIESMTLYDKSFRQCISGHDVNLYHLHYLLYGKTWFMDIFDAVMANQEDQEEFEKADHDFQLYKNQTSWEYFYNSIAHGLYVENITPDEMKQIYITTISWQDFSMKVRDKIGAAEFNVWVAYWIFPFFYQHAQFSFYFPTMYILSFSSSKLQQIPAITCREYIPDRLVRKTRKHMRSRRGTL